MTATRTQKRRRNTHPTLEHLDMRIAPTAMTAAAAIAAELKVEARHVARWEAALATASPGSHRQQVLMNHIARTEHRMDVQDARLAQIAGKATESNTSIANVPHPGPATDPPRTVTRQSAVCGTDVSHPRPATDPPHTVTRQSAVCGDGRNARSCEPHNDHCSRHDLTGPDFGHSIGRPHRYRLAVQPASQRVYGPRPNL